MLFYKLSYHKPLSKTDNLHFLSFGGKLVLLPSLSVCIYFCLVPGGQRCWPWGWPLLWTLAKRKVESGWQEASAGEHCGNGSRPQRQEEQPFLGKRREVEGMGYAGWYCLQCWIHLLNNVIFSLKWCNSSVQVRMCFCYPFSIGGMNDIFIVSCVISPFILLHHSLFWFPPYCPFYHFFPCTTLLEKTGALWQSATAFRENELQSGSVSKLWLSSRP